MAGGGNWASGERAPRARELTPMERAATRKIGAPVLMLVGYAIVLLGLPFVVAINYRFGIAGGDFLWILVALWVFVVLSIPSMVMSRIRRSAREISHLYGPLDPITLSQLTESRREIVAAFEIERRRIERDLHDGAQQYLVTASMDVGEADLVLDSACQGETVDRDLVREARRLLGKAQDDAEAALRALRHTVAGIHPKVLSDMGLESAVRDIAASSSIAVTVRCPNPLPEMTEGVIAAGYFMVSEAITNAAKHAPGADVSVLLAADADLRITVIDAGPGGAEIHPDHGLAGMRERMAAFGGSLTVTSPVGGPTTVAARIPLLLRLGEFGVGGAQ